LPKISPRYEALLKTPESVIEICPEALTCARDISNLIGGSGETPAAGAALIIDYGPAGTIPTNSLRGIRAHKQVSPFYAPGEVDLSVDVDFMAIVEQALAANENVEVHGPVQQADFLLSMGAEERARVLGQSAPDASWRRLVDRGVSGMGRIYKALSIVPARDGKRPLGFGGSL
jgi:NADH dehydrogenase [ubiquinone] 1 alpha subcomplex assembly factor 7